MKILIRIDQRASIAAGVEAPHSTALVDINIETIPARVRTAIAQHWNPRDKRVVINAREAIVTNPPTPDKVIASLQAMIAPPIQDVKI